MQTSRLSLVAAAALLAAGSFPGGHDSAAIRPRKVEVANPTISRGERKRRRRRIGSLPTKIRTGGARAYIAHEQGAGKAPLCRPGWTLPFGPHRLASNEPIMCNDCQRRRWALDQAERKGAR